MALDPEALKRLEAKYGNHEPERNVDRCVVMREYRAKNGWSKPPKAGGQWGSDRHNQRGGTRSQD